MLPPSTLVVSTMPSQWPCKGSKVTGSISSKIRHFNCIEKNRLKRALKPFARGKKGERKRNRKEKKEKRKNEKIRKQRKRAKTAFASNA